MSIDILQYACFALVGAFFAAYTILDGFDLGVGILFPFLGRTPMGKRALLRTLAPVWDGNEVWILGGVTVLIAAFPAVYATVFSGFYLAIILTVVALMLRAVSFEFWSTEEGPRRLWDMLFTGGSLLPPLLLGIALGNVIQGVPLYLKEYNGTLLTLFRPYPVMVGIFSVLVVSIQGASYAAMKTTGELQERARSLRGKLLLAFPIALTILAVLTYAAVPVRLGGIVAWAGIALAIAAWISLMIPQIASNDKLGFLTSSATIGSLWLVAGGLLFPDLVRAEAPEIPEHIPLTVYNSSSPEGTLLFVVAVAAIGLPIVIIYTFLVYRIFKGRVMSIA